MIQMVSASFCDAVDVVLPIVLQKLQKRWFANAPMLPACGAQMFMCTVQGTLWSHFSAHVRRCAQQRILFFSTLSSLTLFQRMAGLLKCRLCVSMLFANGRPPILPLTCKTLKSRSGPALKFVFSVDAPLVFVYRWCHLIHTLQLCFWSLDRRYWNFFFAFDGGSFVASTDVRVARGRRLCQINRFCVCDALMLDQCMLLDNHLFFKSTRRIP